MTSRSRHHDNALNGSVPLQSHFSSSSSPSPDQPHSRRIHSPTTNTAMSHSSSPARQDTPTDSHGSNSGHHNNGGVFDRVVRKLSKRVKPPTSQHDRSASQANASASDHITRNRTVLDPPSYTYVTTGAPSPTVETRAPLTTNTLPNRRGSGNNNNSSRHHHKTSVQEWGPPPLTDQRFAQTLAQQEAEAQAYAQAQSQAALTGTAPRRSSSALRRQLSSSKRPSQHRPTKSAAVQQHPQQYNQLASRSFDSLIGPSSIAQQAQAAVEVVPPPPRYGQAATAGRSASRASPAMASPSAPANATSGLTRKPTISSTTRAKPALDAPPQANIASSHFPVGFWPAGSNDPPHRPSSTSVEELSPEEVIEQTRERESLVGKGPYWSIQRGWSRGIVTTLEEANRRTRGFPGPVVRYFGADELDEALAFYRSGKTSGRRSSALDDSDEEDEDERVKRDSQTSIALGRSVSLMERKSQNQSRRIGRGGMRAARGDRKDVTKEENDSTLQAQSDPVTATSQSQPSAVTTAAAARVSLHSAPLLSSPLSVAVALPILPTQDLRSSLKFYRDVIGLNVNSSDQSDNQATLSMDGRPLLQLRRLPSLTTSSVAITLSGVQDLTTLSTRLQNGLLRDKDLCTMEGWSRVSFTSSTKEVIVTDPSGNNLIFSLLQQHDPFTRSLSPAPTSQTLPRSLSPNNPFRTNNNNSNTTTTTMQTGSLTVGESSLDPRLSLHLGSPFGADEVDKFT